MIKVLPRINELAKKVRVSELTEEEKLEQSSLRECYLTIIRGSSKELLLNSTVVDIL
ncbi:DUF896 domain-containing protein [Desemzia sp. RIT804]|uniref:DUF896 domain-containing protein n=1 Tax=Desemzia sp. RIT 804 TaxID=2810209 RepID=UPI0019520EEA|nr:DUF896 domain-containing protein [Desemzia sp. RIT 804]MBM6615455.1 DUF896 domain-containing protein [Desemzia sp. RIT 804]